VLVFPGNNDGYLVKVADFGLGFLRKEELILPGHGVNALAQSQVGTVWIRAPEVDASPPGTQYDPAAVDVFSFGMVLVDLLTDGEGENIRWEVAYQKKDPKTGKNLLSFGVDVVKLRSILSTVSKRPPGLVSLAVSCCCEDPKQRPTLDQISHVLDGLIEKTSQANEVRHNLQALLEKRETQALEASAAIKSQEGIQIWAQMSDNLKLPMVEAGEVWKFCRELFENYGPVLTSGEADVLAEACGCPEEGNMDAPHFAQVWERLNPIIHLLKNEQLGYLWRSGVCNLFCDRYGAVDALTKTGHGGGLVIRISNSFPGKLTVSFLNAKTKKPVHQILTFGDNALCLGKGLDSKMFAGFHDLFLYYMSNQFLALLGRNGQETELKTLAATIPVPLPPNVNKEGDAGYEEDGYLVCNPFETKKE
jgi:hypothetical protein